MGVRAAAFAHRLVAFFWSLADRLKTFDVRVPGGMDVVWPDSCATCGAGDAPRLSTLRAIRQGGMAALIGFDPWGKKRVWHAPICLACWRHNRKRAWIGRTIPPVVLVVLLLSGLWLSRVLMPVSMWLGYPVFVLAVLGSIGVALIIGVCVGTSIDARWDHNDVVIHFQSRAAAEAFAKANGLAVSEPASA